MNPLLAAGIPGMSGGLNDSGSAVAGDIQGKNQNGGAINFGGGWESAIPFAVVGVTVLVGIYLWKKF
jgi:hypothetical protein